MKRMLVRLASLCLAGFAFSNLVSTPARAVPSFARQTGAPCSKCHITAFGPQLTPYGMQFKLNGYVWGDKKTIPVAGMLLASYNNTEKGQQPEAAPHYKANDNVTVDQVSLFVAGRLYGNLGMFGQGTFDGVAKRTSWDNLDIRYADNFKFSDVPVTWGVTLNNNPTVQDVWGSTPAWAFPWVSSPLAPGPSYAPVIEGAYAQNVLGTTAYGLIDNLVYVEAGAYRTLSQRWQKTLGVVDNTDPMVNGESPLAGPAPYWRLALQHQFGSNYVSVGTFGMSARQNPGGDASYGQDHFMDYAYDATWQYNAGGPNTFSGNLTYVHENQHQNASFNLGAVGLASNDLNTLRLNGSWVYRQTYSLSGGPFQIHGGEDPANGSPNSRGYIVMGEYIPWGKRGSWESPWANLRLGLQYTYYTELDGTGGDTGTGNPSAHDANTLYLFLWTTL